MQQENYFFTHFCRFQGIPNCVLSIALSKFLFAIHFSCTCFELKVFWSSESSNGTKSGNEKVRLGCTSVFLLKSAGKRIFVFLEDSHRQQFCVCYITFTERIIQCCSFKLFHAFICTIKEYSVNSYSSNCSQKI